ncbi:MAG: hypothetical protein G01um10142_505 [Parcubacteria group bacterium Gr01-1014_2]|nr:MAG: hypothetical protein G01um10142_505 [Parcubacteria group bacterium Gr01-1014_2]
MNRDYLLIYGEGKEENRIQFQKNTVREAIQSAQDIVNIRKREAKRPEHFYTKLYREVHEW